jgi:hypothetical protein
MVRPDDQLPRVYGAGPWLAATGRFFPGWGRQVELTALPEVAVEEAKASGGWCKVIADWSVGEGADRRYAPSVPPEVLAEVVRQVHAAGGRVAVHSQHHEGSRPRSRPERIPWSTACTWRPNCWTPRHGREPRWCRQCLPSQPSLSCLPSTLDRSRCARGWRLAGRAIQVAREIGWLARAGVPAEAALGGGSWIARRWLGLPGLEEGAPADVVAYPADPLRELALLEEPSRVILRGRVIR